MVSWENQQYRIMGGSKVTLLLFFFKFLLYQHFLNTWLQFYRFFYNKKKTRSEKCMLIAGIAITILIEHWEQFYYYYKQQM